MKVRTFTCSFGSGQVDRGEVHAILIGMTGCSVAWGIGRPPNQGNRLASEFERENRRVP